MKSINDLLKRAQSNDQGVKVDIGSGLPTVGKIHQALGRLGGYPASQLLQRGPDEAVISIPSGFIDVDIHSLPFYLEQAAKARMLYRDLSSVYSFSPIRRHFLYLPVTHEAVSSMSQSPSVRSTPLPILPKNVEFRMGGHYGNPFSKVWIPVTRESLIGASTKEPIDHVLAALIDLYLAHTSENLFREFGESDLKKIKSAPDLRDLAGDLRFTLEPVLTKSDYFRELSEHLGREIAKELTRFADIRGFNIEVKPSTWNNPRLYHNAKAYYDLDDMHLVLGDPVQITVPLHELGHAIYTPLIKETPALRHKLKGNELEWLRKVLGESFATMFAFGGYAHLLRRASQNTNLRPETRNLARYLYERIVLPTEYGFVVPLKKLESVYEQLTSVNTEEELDRAVDRLLNDPWILVAGLAFGTKVVPKHYRDDTTDKLIKSYLKSQGIHPIYLDPLYYHESEPKKGSP